MIRTKRWKFVRRYPYGPDELYDLNSDPGEEKNLSGVMGFEKIERELGHNLFEWFLKYSDPEIDGVYQPVTGMGQIGPCGRKSKGCPAFNKISLE